MAHCPVLVTCSAIVITSATLLVRTLGYCRAGSRRALLRWAGQAKAPAAAAAAEGMTGRGTGAGRSPAVLTDSEDRRRGVAGSGPWLWRAADGRRGVGTPPPISSVTTTRHGHGAQAEDDDDDADQGLNGESGARPFAGFAGCWVAVVVVAPRWPCNTE